MASLEFITIKNHEDNFRYELMLVIIGITPNQELIWRDKWGVV